MMCDTSKGFSWDTIAAVGATITAIIALVATLWQGCETREHNKLSVKPKLDFVSVRSSSSTINFLGVKVINKGLGPAIIRKLSVIVDGQPVSNDDGHWGLTRAAEHFRLLDIVSYTVFSSNSLIQPQESFDLWMLPEKYQTADYIAKMNKCLESLEIIIEYESMYKEIDFARFATKLTRFKFQQTPNLQK